MCGSMVDIQSAAAEIRRLAVYLWGPGLTREARLIATSQFSRVLLAVRYQSVPFYVRPVLSTSSTAASQPDTGRTLAGDWRTLIAGL